MPEKKLYRVLRSKDHHWVGDGFPVRTLFSYAELDSELSPFLLFTYSGPTNFQPTNDRRGVGLHPHRGFETVTIIYQGELEHCDSSGGGGHLGPGDVQWMTAASGLVHEEFHGREFAEHGGTLEMVQLWVNLPAKDKMAVPRYQDIHSEQIPVFDLPDEQGMVRILAGEYAGVQSPTKTFSPMQVLDLRLNKFQQIRMPLPDGHTTILAVLTGVISTPDAGLISTAEVALFERKGKSICFDCEQDAVVLLLCGKPLNEPIVGQGPFVMNTAEEIEQAIEDYHSGSMGQMP